jgi:hypothetical protein
MTQVQVAGGRGCQTAAIGCGRRVER